MLHRAPPTLLGAGARKVYWQNLREEPLIFINGNPFVVREADQPFSNLEYTGIDRWGLRPGALFYVLPAAGAWGLFGG